MGLSRVYGLKGEKWGVEGDVLVRLLFSAREQTREPVPRLYSCLRVEGNAFACGLLWGCESLRVSFGDDIEEELRPVAPAIVLEGVSAPFALAIGSTLLTLSPRPTLRPFPFS